MNEIVFLTKSSDEAHAINFPDNYEYLYIMFADDTLEGIGQTLAAHAGGIISVDGVGYFKVKLCNYFDKESKVTLGKEFTEFVKPFLSDKECKEISSRIREIFSVTHLDCEPFIRKEILV